MMAEMNTTLAHGGDDVTFERVLIGGRAHWRFSCGTLLPVISGGATEGGDGGEGGEGGDGGTGDGSGGEGQGAPGENGGEGTPPAGKVTFTPEQQAHIDDLIRKNTGKSKAAAEKEFKAWLDQQAMSETDRLKAEKEAADKLVSEARAEALAARVETTAERLALAAGCKPERVSKLLRLIDLTSDDLATEDGKPDTDAIKALVEKELADTPELKGSAGPTTGASGADDMGGAGGGKVWTREEVAKLSVEEFEKHEAEIMKQLQSAGVK